MKRYLRAAGITDRSRRLLLQHTFATYALRTRIGRRSVFAERSGFCQSAPL